MVPGSVSDYREHYFFHTLCVCVLVLLRWLRLSRSTLWLQSGVQQQQRRQTQRELGGESSRAVEERKGKEKNTSRESVHINTYTHTQTETQTQIIEAAKLLLRCADAIQSESDSPSLHLVSFHFTSPPPPPQRPRSLFLACSLFIFKTSPKGRPLADDVSRRQQHYRIFFRRFQSDAKFFSFFFSFEFCFLFDDDVSHSSPERRREKANSWRPDQRSASQHTVVYTCCRDKNI